MSATLAPPSTHSGTRPQEDDGDDNVCHLLHADGSALCGSKGWGLSVNDPDAGRDPCSCGLLRCPRCAEG